MVIDGDTYDSARMLMDRYGVNAAAMAEKRVEALRAEGGDEAATFWCLVHNAIIEMSRLLPEEDDTMH